MISFWQLLTSAATLSLLLHSQYGLANNVDGSCSKESPCEEGCCGASGYCGYGPKYCGEGCVANCDAQVRSLMGVTGLGIDTDL
jgi:hypothetical protein